MSDQSAATETLTSVDPRDGTARGEVKATTAEEVDRACADAGRAFAASDLPDMAPLLRALAGALTGARAELVRVAEEETGLSHARLDGEVDRAAFQLRAFGDLTGTARLREPEIDLAEPGRVPPQADQRSVLYPLGPVAVFAASNFPFAFGVLGVDTAAALAAGCPVVIKAHPAQPRLGVLLTEIVDRAVAEAGADPRWATVVAGGGNAIGEALVRHPAITAVGFTGGFGGGSALVAAAAARPEPIPVFAEMGSVNPVFVAPGAARERVESVAEGWAGTLTASAGQLCTKPGLLILPDRASAERAASLARTALEGGEPLPLLTERFRDGVRRGVDDALSVAGVEGSPPRTDKPGAWASATVLSTDARTVLANPLLFEEIFGPAGIVVACDGPDDARDLAAAMPGSLTASVHADDEDAAWVRDLLPSLRRRAGRLIYNGWPTGVSIGWGTVHGGPWPATSAPSTTSVGFRAARRFMRPVAWQGFPPALLPEMLREG